MIMIISIFLIDNRKRKDPFLSWQGLSQWKATVLYLLCPCQLPFHSYKGIFFILHEGTAHGFPWLQTLNCSSLWILNKPLCAREISGSPFASGQHFGGLFKNRDNSLQFYGSWANGCRPTVEPLLLTALLVNHGVWKSIFLLIQSHALFAFEAL